MKGKKIKIQEPNMTEVARQVMEKRYLMVDMEGNVLETPGEMFKRVAKHMAKAEVLFNSTDEHRESLKW
jgi:ribonucleoside-diphosphate reductase alpha chain